jgi:hypothetical protein
MKIALIGPVQSGKTVYWSALYHRYRDSVTLPILTPAMLRNYKAWGVTTQVGFRISIANSDLKKELARNAELLGQNPIQWPLPTRHLDQTESEVQFDFVPLKKYKNADNNHDIARSYVRSIEIYDPPGGAFSGTSQLSSEIVDQIKTCDAAVIFLPMDHILPAVRVDEIDSEIISRAYQKMLIGPIKDVMMGIKENANYDDVFPVCFVISKADECLADEFGNVSNFLYDEDYGLIKKLSRENPDIMMCVCPISVMDQKTKLFRAMNLEWPFLFSAAATIFRNHIVLLQESEDDLERAGDFLEEARREEIEADDLEDKAKELAAQNMWRRFRAWMRGEKVSLYRNSAAKVAREAARKYQISAAFTTQAGRKIQLSRDDQSLASDVWLSLSVEGKARKIAILRNGEIVNNISSTMNTA